MRLISQQMRLRSDPYIRLLQSFVDLDSLNTTDNSALHTHILNISPNLEANDSRDHRRSPYSRMRDSTANDTERSRSLDVSKMPPSMSPHCNWMFYLVS